MTMVLIDSNAVCMCATCFHLLVCVLIFIKSPTREFYELVTYRLT